MAILYVASEAAELKPFADHLTGLRKLKWPLDYAWEGIWEGRRILLAANGAGPKLAGHVVEIAIRAAMVAELSSSRLETVVSTGFCGALDPALRESQIVVATRVTSLATGESFECAEISANGEFVAGPVASQDRVANDSVEKTRLFDGGSVAIEMEAAGVAARAKRAGLPFCCIKVVSDRADESFPFDLNRMRSPEGRIARGKIGVHALTHPKAISSLLRLKRRSESAARILGEFLVGSRVIANAASLQPES
jgi:adenosylhomocysteine nucleosidase